MFKPNQEEIQISDINEIRIFTFVSLSCYKSIAVENKQDMPHGSNISHIDLQKW